jgi:hypothetical protein
MKRLTRVLPRRFATALGRGLLVLAAVLWGLVPSMAWAGTAYTIHWVHTEDATSCEGPFLRGEGQPMSSVNQTSLPTYTVPGAYQQLSDGSQRNRMEAEFDSVLLYMGANDFGFRITASTGEDSCVLAHELASLVSEPLGLNEPLFDVRRAGTAYEGRTRVDLSLAEINPPLARDIETRKAAIAEERRVLINNASRVADLAWRLDRLRQLDTELSNLVQRPLDEIARTDLKAILDRYTRVVDARTRGALRHRSDPDPELGRHVRRGAGAWPRGAWSRAPAQNAPCHQSWQKPRPPNVPLTRAKRASPKGEQASASGAAAS